MNYSDRMVVSFVALVAFLASIGVAVKGSFVYPLELGLLALLGVLLAASLILPEGDAASAFLYVLFFIGMVANVAYLYSVAGYLNTARLIALALGVGGLVLSSYNMLKMPVPLPAGKVTAPKPIRKVTSSVTSEVRRLMAAEKKLSEARKRLETIHTGKAAPKRKGKRRK